MKGYFNLLKQINMTSKIYCLGGLVMDEQIFQNIHPEGAKLVHIKYNEPLKGESLKHYSKRLFDKIHLPEKYQLLGVSFGGMIATEFFKIREPEKLYLVSTVSYATEVPLKFKIAYLLRLHKIFSGSLVKYKKIISSFVTGVKREKDHERINSLLSNVDAEFLNWALGSLFSWENTLVPNAIRIHGTKDRILPYSGNADYPIKDGTHFIMSNRTEEIAKILSHYNRR
jgi:hypothetical protein